MTDTGESRPLLMDRPPALMSQAARQDGLTPEWPTTWLVNVASPFPSERRDRNYGPFTEAEAHAFAEGLPSTWRAEVRPVFAADQVRSP